MFLERTMERNPELIEIAFQLHRTGKARPDSYIVDMDTLLDNAARMLEKSKELDFRLFFMLKQLGRNPYIARELVKLGYEGAVVVDFKEAKVMMEAGIPICNVGNLVQIPEAMVEQIVDYRPAYITAFSLEKIRRIDQAAKRRGVTQDILLRVFDDSDMVYSGQTAGFSLCGLEEAAKTVMAECSRVRVAGVTSFPCYLYDEAAADIAPTKNLETVLKAERLLKGLGLDCELINTPSATCSRTIELMRRCGGNCGEPGHGLSGTTPMHADRDLEEAPCVVYLSEISHNFQGKAYCYGGGHYRRSHVKQALVGPAPEKARVLSVEPPSDESIDYHFGLPEICAVGDAALMAFRFQIFVTRSDVVLVKGIRKGEPEVAGIYDSLGRRL